MTSLTPDEARELIYQRFVDLWVDAGAARTAYVLGDDSADPPAEIWARLFLRHSYVGAATLGDVREFDREGRIFGHLNTPPNQGSKQCDELAHAFLAIFEGKSFGGIKVFDGDFRESPGGRWYRNIVSLRFLYRERK